MGGPAAREQYELLAISMNPGERSLRRSSTSGSGYSIIGMSSVATSLSRRQPRVSSSSCCWTNARSSCRLSNGPFDETRLEIVGDDVLSQLGVAANVALGRRVEHFGVEHSDDVTQVQIAIGERRPRPGRTRRRDSLRRIWPWKAVSCQP